MIKKAAQPKIRLFYSIINTEQYSHVVDTMFYNEANFFYNLGPEYEIVVKDQYGNTRPFQDKPLYIPRSK